MYYKIYACHKKYGWERITTLRDYDKIESHIEKINKNEYYSVMVISYDEILNMDECIILKHFFCDNMSRKLNRKLKKDNE